MNSFLKSKIRFYQVVCMVGLLFVHNYNFAQMVITPSTIVVGKPTFTAFFELFFSNSFFRFRLPILMAISGYLMANSKELPFDQLLVKKFKSLLVPYVLISCISLLLTLFFEFFIYGLHSEVGILGKSLWHFSFREYVGLIFINPVSFQLWYLKTIFLLAIISPIISFILKRFPLEALSILFLIWMFTNRLGGDIRDRGYIFYVLGFYLRIYDVDVSKPISFFKPIYALVLFISICFIRTGITLYGEHISNAKNLLIMLFKLNEMLGLYACWFCFDRVISIFVENKWFKETAGSSFFIYAFHAPLINFIAKFLLLRHFYFFAGAHITTYLLVPVFLFPFLILLNKLVYKYLPTFYLLLTGKRDGKQKEESSTDLSNSLINLVNESTYLNIGLYI